MDVETARVLRGWLLLTREQQNDFVRALNEIFEGKTTRSATKSLSESIINVSTGPLTGTCGCCGR